MTLEEFTTHRWFANTKAVYFGSLPGCQGPIYDITAVDFEEMSVELGGHGASFWTSFVNIEIVSPL